MERGAREEEEKDDGVREGAEAEANRRGKGWGGVIFCLDY